jgi:hypothetical protein
LYFGQSFIKFPKLEPGEYLANDWKELKQFNINNIQISDAAFGSLKNLKKSEEIDPSKKKIMSLNENGDLRNVIKVLTFNLKNNNSRSVFKDNVIVSVFRDDKDDKTNFHKIITNAFRTEIENETQIPDTDNQNEDQIEFITEIKKNISTLDSKSKNELQLICKKIGLKCTANKNVLLNNIKKKITNENIDFENEKFFNDLIKSDSVPQDDNPHLIYKKFMNPIGKIKIKKIFNKKLKKLKNKF